MVVENLRLAGDGVKLNSGRRCLESPLELPVISSENKGGVLTYWDSSYGAVLGPT